MDYPGHVPSHLTTICTYSPELPGMLALGGALLLGTAVSTTWPSANRAIHIPLTLMSKYTVKMLFWVNGGTVNNTIDAGIYSAGGTLITSTGATTQTGTSAVQQVTLGTPVTLMPGRYYMALWSSSGTNTIHANAVVLRWGQIAGVTQQDSVTTSLATSAQTMTPATITSAYYPLFGIARVTSI